MKPHQSDPPPDTASHPLDECWLETPEGANAQPAVCRMTRFLVSGWLRRNATLLHVGCGAVSLTVLFHEIGFDVTGVTASPDLLDKARAHIGSRADLQLAAPDELPFDDNSFDFVAIPFFSPKTEDEEKTLGEAVRVAARGVLIGFFNTCSWHGMTRRRARMSCHSPFRLWRLLRKTAPAAAKEKLTFRSTLLLPVSQWDTQGVLAHLNAAPLPIPLGAYAAFRADFAPHPAMTPLGLRLPFLNARGQRVCLLSKRWPFTSLVSLE